MSCRTWYSVLPVTFDSVVDRRDVLSLFTPVPYQIVEVNPLTKNEIGWSAYKKVPIVTLNGEQINDSSVIMTELEAKLAPKKKAGFFGAKKQAQAEAGPSSPEDCKIYQTNTT